MSLAREVVLLDKALTERSKLADLFRPGSRQRLAAAPEAAQVLKGITAAGGADAPLSLLLALQSLRVQRAELAPRLIDAVFVATVPGDLPDGAQPTDRVILDMLRNAKSEVIALGYEVSDQGFLSSLSDAAERGASVTLICDKKRAIERKLSGLRLVPSFLRVYVDALDDEGAPYAKMHSKCLLVDQTDLLITSANFTFHGMHGNIEVGVRLNGGPAAEARKLFEHLERSGFLRPATDAELSVWCR